MSRLRERLRDWTTWTGLLGAGVNVWTAVRTYAPAGDALSGERLMFWVVILPLTVAFGVLLYGVLPWWLRKRSRYYRALGAQGPGRAILCTLAAAAVVAALSVETAQLRSENAALASGVAQLESEVGSWQRSAIEAIALALDEMEIESGRIASEVSDLESEVRDMRWCLDSIQRSQTTITVEGGGYYYSIPRRVSVLAAPLLIC